MSKAKGGTSAEKIVKESATQKALKKLMTERGTKVKANDEPKMDLDGLVKRATAQGNGTVMDTSGLVKSVTGNLKPKAKMKEPKVACDRHEAARKAWKTSRDKILAGIHRAMKVRKS